MNRLKSGMCSALSIDMRYYRCIQKNAKLYLFGRWMGDRRQVMRHEKQHQPRTHHLIQSHGSKSGWIIAYVHVCIENGSNWILVFGWCAAVFVENTNNEYVILNPCNFCERVHTFLQTSFKNVVMCRCSTHTCTYTQFILSMIHAIHNMYLCHVRATETNLMSSEMFIHQLKACVK